MRIDVHELPAYVLTNSSNEEYITKGKHVVNTLFELGYQDIIKYKGVNYHHPTGGCDKSHLKLHSDPDITTPYVVFEDDISPLRTDHVFDIPDDADALFLGTSCWSKAWNFWMNDAVIYSNISEDIVKVNNMLCTHALVVLTDSYRDILRRCNAYSDRTDTDGIASDQYVIECMRLFNVYSVDEPVFCQSGRYNPATIKSVRSSGWDYRAGK